MRKSMAAVLIAALATAGCNRVHAQDSGPRVSRNYQVGNFQQIEVEGSYDVDVRTGANPGVSARGGEKLLNQTLVEVQGDKLVIRPQRNGSWWHGMNGHATFTVTVPQLSSASIGGSGDVKIDRIQGGDFDGAVAGSGSLQLGSVEVQELKLSVAGSGDIKAAGKAQSIEFNSAGSGDIDAGGVQSQDAKISTAGSGDIKAHATGGAQISMMGSGDVEITGGAKCQVSKMGSGTANCS